MQKKAGKSVLCSRVQYKCRKCGKVFVRGNFYEKLTEISARFFNLNYTDKQRDYLNRLIDHYVNYEDPCRYRRVDLFDTHICKDGSCGLADLCGWEKPKDLPYHRGDIKQP